MKQEVLKLLFFSKIENKNTKKKVLYFYYNYNKYYIYILNIELFSV